MKNKEKTENFVRRTITVPKVLDKIAQKEIKKQEIHRNVNYSSFVVEILASHLLK